MPKQTTAELIAEQTELFWDAEQKANEAFAVFEEESKKLPSHRDAVAAYEELVAFAKSVNEKLPVEPEESDLLLSLDLIEAKSDKYEDQIKHARALLATQAQPDPA